MSAPDLLQVAVDGPKALDCWQAENHAAFGGIWLVTRQKRTGARQLSPGPGLDALLSRGWIDVRRVKRDTDRKMPLFAPRREETSARTCTDLAARLITEGRMQPAGLAAMERSKRPGV